MACNCNNIQMKTLTCFNKCGKTWDEPKAYTECDPCPVHPAPRPTMCGSSPPPLCSDCQVSKKIDRTMGSWFPTYTVVDK
jgi:hypothetical protein